MSDENAIPDFDHPIGYDDENEDTPDLGTCCACGGHEHVRNVIMLHQTAPVPGTGWGCIVCGAPPDGAIAVVCDACLEAQVDILFVVEGYASDKQRIGIKAYAHTPFDHDNSKHPEAFAWLK